MRSCVVAACLVASLLVSGGAVAQSVTPAFTYQGRIVDSNTPVSGPVDLRFRLYGAAAGGTPLGSQLAASVVAEEGLVTVSLNFGPGVFDGGRRWLEIDVAVGGSGVYRTLAPRQELLASPHASFATVAGSANQLNGQPPSYYLSAGNLTGTLPAAALSGSYSGAVTLSNSSNTFTGSGANLTNLRWSSLTGVPAFLTSVQTSNDFSGNGTPGSPLTLSSFGALPGYVLRWNNGWTSVPDSLILPYSGAVSSADPLIAVTNGGTGLAARLQAQNGAFSAITSGPTGPTNAAYFENRSTSGTAVYGVATSTSGSTTGAYFENRSDRGNALRARATNSAGGAAAAWFEAAGTNGIGVYAASTGASGNAYGALFENLSGGGTALYAVSGVGSGPTYAVRGRVYSNDGWAGYFEGRSYFAGNVGIGERNPGAALEVKGAAGDALYVLNTASGRGAQIVAPNDTAVWARTDFGFAAIDARSNNPAGRALTASNNAASGVNFGVYGFSASPDGWAVFAQGRSGATGTKSFVIDHPLDPTNKVLLHYSTESPEPLNTYSGTVTTDAEGWATVTLPDYFQEINTDLRYQLTVIDETEEFIMAKVAREARDNRFVVRTSLGNVKVSWQVQGVRNDAWVKRYGFRAEQDKPAESRGTYLSPELYGGQASSVTGH